MVALGLLCCSTCYGEEPVVLDAGLRNVTSLVFSPDDKLLVSRSGYKNGVVTIWDLRIQRVVHQCDGSLGLYSPNGKMLAVVSNDPDGKSLLLITLWEVSTRQARARLPYDALLLSHGDVQIWDFVQMKPIDVFRPAVGGATAVAFSADGSRLALGTTEGKVYLWHFRTTK